MILALDASAPEATLALLTMEGDCRECITWTSTARDTNRLLEEWANLLHRAGIRPGQLQALAVGTGPGRFSGLRAGLCAAEGFALPLQIPVVGVSSGLAVAGSVRRQHPHERITVTGDARRGTCWHATVDGPDIEGLDDPAWAVLPVDRLPELWTPDTLVVSSEPDRLRAHLPDTCPLLPAMPDAVVLGRIALRRLQGPTPPPPPEILYVHPPVA